MRELLETVARVGPTDVTVLVRGETGTGKELIASLLHAQSSRSSAPLVRFNCAAIPDQLAEAELFGHTRGAFSGAERTRPGFFSLATGGTIVLDEVGDRRSYKACSGNLRFTSLPGRCVADQPAAVPDTGRAVVRQARSTSGLFFDLRRNPERRNSGGARRRGSGQTPVAGQSSVLIH